MEVFKEKVAPETPEIAPQAPKVEYEDNPINPNTNPALEPNKALERLEIWEGEKKKKFVNEYFNTHQIGNDFIWKMPLSAIDKFVRGEMEKRGYDKTTANYRNVLSEMEQEIGSEKLELSKRLFKLRGYINAMAKLYSARKLKEKYLIPHIPD